MTKKQVAKKINDLFKTHTKMLEAEIDKVLREADMWYGEDLNYLNKKNTEDRNADLLVQDGFLDDGVDVNHWFKTRKEMGL